MIYPGTLWDKDYFFLSHPGTSLVVQWLRPHTPYRSPGSILGQATRSYICHNATTKSWHVIIKEFAALRVLMPPLEVHKPQIKPGTAK